MPPASIRFPARMKNGIAISGKPVERRHQALRHQDQRQRREERHAADGGSQNGDGDGKPEGEEEDHRHEHEGGH